MVDKKAACAACGSDAENVFQVEVKSYRTIGGDVEAWHGELCESCLKERTEGMMYFRARPVL